jgi:hypothetical protein
MDINDLTVNQLKRAAAIKEQIEALNKELGDIFGASSNGAASTEKRTMSASAKRKIAAAQRARWSKLRRDDSATHSVKPAAKPKLKKKIFSPGTRAKLSARLKAYWAAKKAGKK